jgi:ABC-type sulfate transport system permease component
VAGLALSVIVKVPLLEPAAVGVKVTLMVQEALGARLEPQGLVWEKSPLAVMLVIVRAALPVLVRVRV